MRTFSITIAGAGLMAAYLGGCATEGSSTQPDPTETSASALGALVAGEAVDVPTLDCATRAVLSRPEYTLYVRPGADGASGVAGGTAVLRRYSLVDGQAYVVGYWSVNAHAAADASDASHIVVENGFSTFALDVAEDGAARLEARNAFGLPITLDLTCAAPSPVVSGPKGGPKT